MTRVRSLTPELLALWAERHLCTVTTLRADGSPHVVPMGVALDPDLGEAWAITSRHSFKVAHLRTDPRIAVCQVDGRRWCTVDGVAEVSDDPEVVREAEERYAARYRTPRPNPERVGVRIRITRVVGNA